MYMIKELYNKVELVLWERYILLYHINGNKDYNLSLDVANFLSMALGSDTHTLAHFHE